MACVCPGLPVLSMQVMYQLLWRALLEPRAASVEEEWEAIQKYSMGVAEVRGGRPSRSTAWAWLR